MKFVCDVFNKVYGFCDRYIVVAQNSKEAQKELIARGFDIIRITGIVE